MVVQGFLNSATELLFYTGGYDNNSDRHQQMIINSSGKHWDGIVAPTSKLHQDSGTGTATYHQFTAGTTTGQTVNDGTLIGYWMPVVMQYSTIKRVLM